MCPRYQSNCSHVFQSLKLTSTCTTYRWKTQYQRHHHAAKGPLESEGIYGPLPSMSSLTQRADKPKRKGTKDVSKYFAGSTEERDEYEKQLIDTVSKGGHTILCVLGGGADAQQLWHQVETIVAIVRRTHTTPLVVVASSSINFKSILRLLTLRPNGSTLFLLEGDPKRMRTLLRAGVSSRPVLLWRASPRLFYFTAYHDDRCFSPLQ